MSRRRRKRSSQDRPPQVEYDDITLIDIGGRHFANTLFTKGTRPRVIRWSERTFVYVAGNHYQEVSAYRDWAGETCITPGIPQPDTTQTESPHA